MKIRIIIALIFALIANSSNAALEVTITKKDENTFPIAVSKFKLIGKDAQNKDISKIIRDDLNRSGRFDVFIPDAIIEKYQTDFWKTKGIEALVIGSIEQKSSKIYQLSVSLYDIYSNAELFTHSAKVDISGFRKISHQISDDIYEALLGENGSFNTLLTYITVTKNAKGEKTYQLNISDSDAKNAESRIQQKSPMLSPVWSPERRYKDKKIAFVSFKNARSEVYIWYPFVSKKLQKLPHFGGIVSSPSWHPSGKKLLMTMSYKGNKDIYSYNLTNNRFTRLTRHPSIDTEANYSPDGNSIVFTSNRSGQTQIHIKNLTTGAIKRITKIGKYNAKASYSPDGKHLALVHRTDDDYRIAMFDLKNQELNIMSNGILDESPHFSPNGDMLIYSSNQRGKGVLSVISVRGNRAHQLSSQNAEVREPNWSIKLKR